MNQPNRILKIKHVNIQSIYPKLELLKNYIGKSKADIISINETWLKPEHTIYIDNFNIERSDRPTGARGGGACLIIHNSINYTRVETSPIEGANHVTIQIHNCIKEKQDLFITTLYSPPQIKLDEVNLMTFINLGKNILILGDLNAHHPAWSSKSTNKSGETIYELLGNNKITMLNNNEPTYQPQHRLEYKAILDFALCSPNLSALVGNFSVSDEIRSDHLLIQLTINTKNKNYIRATRETKTIKTINWQEFKLLVKTQNLVGYEFGTIDELETSTSKFTESLQNIIAEATSTKTITIDPEHHLQLPGYILEKIKFKRKLERKYNMLRHPYLKTQINRLAEIIKYDIINHKRTKFKRKCNELNEYKVSDTKLWRTLDDIDNFNKSKTSKKTPVILINGIPTSDPRIVAEEFGNNQQAIFQEPTDASFDDEFKQRVESGMGNLFNRTTNQDEPKLATIEEINAIIKTTKRKASPGPDQINNIIIKLLPVRSRQIILDICNASITLGHVPHQWKGASMIMIPKPMQDTQQTNNYRGISLLNSLSKILEKVVQARTRLWTESNNILSKYQCGFRYNKQTRDQIIRLLQNGLKALNRNEQMAAIFIDIEKAFDKVWHKGLLFQLEELKIPSYLGRWMQSYLSNRYFRVRIGQAYSTDKYIDAGMPQGSILGPDYFNIYFNDIVNFIFSFHLDQAAQRGQLGMFADDLAAWASAISIKTVESTLQAMLNNIELWMNKWRMKVSIKKTIYIVLDKNGRDMGNQMKLTYKNNQLVHCTNPKFLGVTIDPALKLNKYIDITTQRAQRRMNLLKSIKGKNWGASSKLIIILYKTLVRPLLEYVPFVTLVLTMPQYLRLEKIQRQAVRKAIYWPQGVSTKDIYQQYNIRSIQDRAIYLTNNYINRAHNLNIIIKELIDDYNLGQELDEGAYCRTTPRPTILGKIKQLGMPSSILLQTSTTQLQHMQIFTQNFIENN
jgi:hypothetical protein